MQSSRQHPNHNAVLATAQRVGHAAQAAGLEGARDLLLQLGGGKAASPLMAAALAADVAPARGKETGSLQFVVDSYCRQSVRSMQQLGWRSNSCK